MLIILEKPIESDDFDTIAININVFDSFIIAYYRNEFELAVRKTTGSEENRTKFVYYRLHILPSKEECLELFKAIIKALDKKVFDVKEYFDKK